ncbi:MAG: dihydrodipicolinate synthase family protein [Geminicoccaceae bacterium]
MTTLRLPTETGTIEPYTLQGEALPPPHGKPVFNRVAMAAAHVVSDPLSAIEPSAGGAVDWERTLAYRDHLSATGSPSPRPWTRRSAAGPRLADGARADPPLGRECASPQGCPVFSGCGTDQLDPADASSLDDVIGAYLTQMDAIQAVGGRVILMASRALARIASGPDDYARVYGKVLAHAEEPVILHWLGEMFDPALAGYWGGDDFDRTMATCLAVISDNVAKVDGIKVSLLDAEKEIVMRRRLPEAVRMYSGDDFAYPTLIKGDAHGHSDALLGIFDAIAPAACHALAALAKGDSDAYDRIFAPTVPLSRLIFRSPTRFYKTGVVFMAWLNGHQDHFTMLGGQQAMRPLPYFAGIFRLADQAGLLRDPGLAARRMRQLLDLHGVEA